MAEFRHSQIKKTKKKIDTTKTSNQKKTPPQTENKNVSEKK